MKVAVATKVTMPAVVTMLGCGCGAESRHGNAEREIRRDRITRSIEPLQYSKRQGESHRPGQGCFFDIGRKLFSRNSLRIPQSDCCGRERWQLANNPGAATRKPIGPRPFRPSLSQPCWKIISIFFVTGVQILPHYRITQLKQGSPPHLPGHPSRKEAFMPFTSTVAVFLFTLAQIPDATTTKGRVVGIEAEAVTIAVRAGEEPAIGDKVEIYIELPDLDGIAVIGAGRVTEVKESAAIARLETKTGRIDKNQMVRLTSAKGRVVVKPESTTPEERPGLTFTLPSTVPPVAPQSAPPGPSAPAQPVMAGKPVLPNPGIGVRPALPDGQSDFGITIKSFQQAVMSVGDPDRKDWGTGFVISRAHRLIATNAHVADIAKIAVLNESRTNYKVERIWYHPGVVRVMDDGKTLIQSANPADGRVHPEFSDVAILKLEAVGPDLPAEVRLASPDRAQSILGSAIGIFGYPGYNHDQEIRPDLYASATFVRGSVSRLTGLRHIPDAPAAQRHSVSYDARTHGGFSGSPVFQANGEVVALHNHSHKEGGVQTLASGIRVDVLWELLHKENICDLVSGEPVGLAERVSFALPVDPRVEKLQRARKLLSQSADEILHDEFREAKHLLDDAIQILPDYWRLYHQKSKNIIHLMGDEWEEMSVNDKIRYTKESLNNLQTASLYYQQSMGGLSATLVLDQARDLLTLGRVGGDRVAFQKAVAILDEGSLRNGMTSSEAAHLLALRGAAKTELNDLSGALTDLTDAIRLSPKAKTYYENRAWVWSKMGRPAEAARDRERHRQILVEEHHHHHD